MALDTSNVDAAVISAFGETITYTPDGGSPTSIEGFWQEPDVQPQTGELEFTTQGPMVTVLSADVPSPSNLDLVTRDGTGQNYQVKEFEIDEGTLVGLQLEETA